MENENKKILILSTDFEQTTVMVMKWLKKFGQAVVRINRETPIKIGTIDLGDKTTDFSIVQNKEVLTLSEVKSYWYRRGGITIKDEHLYIKSEKKELDEIGETYKSYIKDETRELRDYIYYSLENAIPSLGKRYNNLNRNNKLVHFQIARSIGLTIPFTKTISTKEELIACLKANQTIKFVSKAINNGFDISFTLNNESYFYLMYTEDFSTLNIDEIPSTFYPTLIQEKIEKKYEIRIFFLLGKFYSMAIFSQNDDQTQLDFRKYNKTRPNRCVPYNLPQVLKDKLTLFMKRVNLNTGSIDLILNKNGEYVFLEVNPVGQFGMVSIPCNYYLEYEVAKSLINIQLCNPSTNL